MADLFRPLLPSDIGIASGVLISAFDEGQSAQQDIIIFDRRIIPPILFEQGPAIVPVESALVCIEVKSKLTASELRKAHDSANSVRGLYLHSGTRDRNGRWVGGRSSGISSQLLALDTDLTAGGLSESERYKTLLNGEMPWIAGICVAGRSYSSPTERVIFDKPSGRFFKEDGTPVLGTWRDVPSDGEHAEMLELIGGIIQLIQRIGSMRGQPPLDAYFKIEEEEKNKVRLTSGANTGWYVGLSAEADAHVEAAVRGMTYSFYQDGDKAFEFFRQNAEIMQVELKKIGLDSELV